MQITDILSTLEASAAYTAWRKANPDAYLAHLFCMIESDATTWQVGYYDRKTDAITSFDITADSVEAHPPEAVYKKDGATVKELKRDSVKIEIDAALDTAKELQRRKYPAELPIKHIVVLQTLAAGQVYNITYVTKGFKTLNIKISSETGKVVDEQLAPIFSFDKGEAEGKQEDA